MTKTIELNGTSRFEFDSFSRNTNVEDGELRSHVYVTLKDQTPADAETLRGMALTPITGILILVDGKEIYNMADLNGKISSIDESLNEFGTMTSTLYITL